MILKQSTLKTYPQQFHMTTPATEYPPSLKSKLYSDIKTSAIFFRKLKFRNFNFNSKYY